jgi:hypothetical protein
VVDFVIVNRSAAPIEIALELKEHHDMYFETGILAGQPLSDDKYDFQKWNKLSAHDYRLNDSGNEINVTLNPQEALRVETITNYDESSSYLIERFRINRLKVSGTNGEVVYSGEQARIQFRETGSGPREIVYQ